jgi:hypothetical protein
MRDLLFEYDAHLERDADFPELRGSRGSGPIGDVIGVEGDGSDALSAQGETVAISSRETRAV